MDDNEENSVVAAIRNAGMLPLRMQIKELANTIALQAEAIAKGTAVHEHGAIATLLNNAETLKAWSERLHESQE
jgi:hypothetical protein